MGELLLKKSQKHFLFPLIKNKNTAVFVVCLILIFHNTGNVSLAPWNSTPMILKVTFLFYSLQLPFTSYNCSEQFDLIISETCLFQKLRHEKEDVLSNIISNHCAINELLMVQSSGLGVFEPEICMSEGYNLLFEVLLN